MVLPVSSADEQRYRPDPPVLRVSGFLGQSV